MPNFESKPPSLSEEAVTGGFHAAEIASREFPRAKKGLDPESVRRWLRTVSDAYSALQDEAGRLRAQRDRVAAALRAARERGPSSSVRAALRQAKLRRALNGYDRNDVETLLEAAASELARLETRCALLEGEIDAIRHRRTGADEERIARLEREIGALKAKAQLRAAPVEPIRPPLKEVT